MSNNVVHFEIFVDDLERAKKFYFDVLGWAFNFMEGMDYTLVYPGGKVLEGPAKVGINGGMALRTGPAQKSRSTPNAFVCTVAVDDLDAVLAKVESGGGTIDAPAESIPGIGRLAYIRDTEFNMIGLLQPFMK
jgi:uncharacterized protein